jgi:hypothetical protein
MRNPHQSRILDAVGRKLTRKSTLIHDCAKKISETTYILVKQGVLMYLMPSLPASVDDLAKGKRKRWRTAECGVREAQRCIIAVRPPAAVPIRWTGSFA